MVTRDQAASARSEPDYVFDFCGGHLAIDFTNTVGSRGRERAQQSEHFATFGDIVAWAEAAGVVGRQRAVKLRAYAAQHPDAARRDVRRALELRESLYNLLSARARGRAAHANDLAVLNRFVADTYAAAALSPSGSGFALETPPRDGLDAVVRPVVRAAVDLLTAAHPHRLGLCADDSCAWLFVDATRSGTRRWCDMKSCGNRNKVRRFRASV